MTMPQAMVQDVRLDQFLRQLAPAFKDRLRTDLKAPEELGGDASHMPGLADAAEQFQPCAKAV